MNRAMADISWVLFNHRDERGTIGSRRHRREERVMSTARTERGRAAHAAEKARASTIEAMIGEAARGAGIDFEAARTSELERVEITEPSALALERERRRTMRAGA